MTARLYAQKNKADFGLSETFATKFANLVMSQSQRRL